MKKLSAIFIFLFLSAAYSEESTIQKKLTLELCQTISLDTNPLNRAACEGVQIAKEITGMAQAPYYPQIDGHAHYDRWQKHNFFRLNIPPGTPIPSSIVPNVIGPTDDFGYSVDSSYTLYDWGKRRAELMEALANLGAACEDAQRIKQEILLNVSVAFYNLIANYELEKVAIKNLERAEKHHHLTKEKQEVGAVPLSDVLRAQVVVAEGKQELVRSQSLVRISKVNLNSAIGLPPNINIEIEFHQIIADSPSSIDLKGAQNNALLYRPEIKSLQKQLLALKYQIKSAESSFGPKFTAVGGYGRRDSNFPPKDPEWAFGVSMDVPIFTGYELTHNLRRTQAEFYKAKAEYDRIKLNVQNDVWISYSRLLEAYEMIQTSIAQVRDAEESMRLTEERYNIGAGIISDLLDAQTSLARAEAVNVDAIWKYQSALSTFFWSQGLMYVKHSR